MNVAGREQQPIPGLERQLQLIPEMAAETADLAECDILELRRRDRAARRKHVELDASTIDFAAFEQCVPRLEKLASIPLNPGDRLLQEAAVDVNPGRQTGLNFRRAALSTSALPRWALPHRWSY